jgi:hypothetical protein
VNKLKLKFTKFKKLNLNWLKIEILFFLQIVFSHNLFSENPEEKKNHFNFLNVIMLQKFSNLQLSKNMHLIPEKCRKGVRISKKL